MREVEISEDGDLVGVICPMCLNAPYETPMLSCDSFCAWFSIAPETVRVGGVSHPNTGDKFAYCKDHCIGKIKESE